MSRYCVSGAGMSLCYLCSFITISWVFHENPGVSLVVLTTGSSLGQVVMPYVVEVSDLKNNDLMQNC